MRMMRMPLAARGIVKYDYDKSNKTARTVRLTPSEPIANRRLSPMAERHSTRRARKASTRRATLQETANTYSLRFNGAKSTPQLTLRGQWLAAAKFAAGRQVVITVEDGRLT